MDKKKFLMMMSGEQSYDDLMLSMSPIAYWPMDEASGSTVLDATGNGRTGTSANVTLAQPGQIGNSYKFLGASNSLITPSAALTAALTVREYSFACWLKVDANAGLQVRVVNTYSDVGAEYSVLEVRTGVNLSVFVKENGVTQTVNQTEVGVVTDEQWHLVVFFNSESTGNTGIWFDGELRAVPRTGEGADATVPDANYPAVGAFLDGWIQKAAFFNRLLTEAEVTALWQKGRKASTWALSYDLQDEFSVEEAAPMASPRASGLVITDTGNKFAIAAPGGEVAWSTKTTDVQDPRMMVALSSVGARMIKAAVTPGSLHIGFDNAATVSPQDLSYLMQSSTLYVEGGSGSQMALGAIVTNGTVEYQVALIKRPLGGGYWYIKGGTFAAWTRVLATRSLALDGYGGFGPHNQNVVTKVNYIRSCVLPAPFTELYGVSDLHIDGKTAAQTFTHTADGQIDFWVYTMPTGANIIDLRFRRQDADNYWQITIDSTGALVLNEVVATTPTARGTSAGVIAVGDHVIIKFYGMNIYAIDINASLYTRRIAYASAANFQTATAGELVTVGDAIIGNLCVWSSTASAAEIAILDAV